KAPTLSSAARAPDRKAGDRSAPDDPGDVAHFPSGPRLVLAVEMQRRAAVAEDVAPAIRLLSDEIAHLDLAVPARRAERPAADRPHMLLELGGHGAVDGPMAGIVNAGRDFVDDEGLAVHPRLGLLDDEHLDADHAHIAERVHDFLRHGYGR